MPRKAELLQQYHTLRALVRADLGGRWDTPPRRTRVAWNQPDRELYSDNYYARGTAATTRPWLLWEPKPTKGDEEDERSGEAIHARCQRWRAEGYSPEEQCRATRVDYQQLGNRKPKQKFQRHGRDATRREFV
jgi:hypothetical protein